METLVASCPSLFVITFSKASKYQVSFHPHSHLLSFLVETLSLGTFIAPNLGAKAPPVSQWNLEYHPILWVYNVLDSRRQKELDEWEKDSERVQIYA